jgi:uncharacterized membrane protein YedE/YeeE
MTMLSDVALEPSIAFVIGITFGASLERAGLGSAKKLMGQFDLTDLTVLKVMFSAIVTAMLGLFWLSRAGVVDVSYIYIPETFLAPQLVGGLLFGVGFAIAGLCPGTSCVAAATGRVDGLAVVLGMLSGVLLTGAVLPAMQGFYLSTARGAFVLPQLFGVSEATTVLAVTALAIAVFVVSGPVERGARARRVRT